MGQLSNITTRWRHQTVVKEREITVNNFYQKAVKNEIIQDDIKLKSGEIWLHHTV